MAVDKKISDLDPAGALTGNEQTELLQVGKNVRSTLTYVKNWIEANFIGVFNSIKFNVQSITPAWVMGLLFYDEQEDCLVFYNSRINTAKQLGRELSDRFLNDTGITITNGQAVYVSGYDVTTGVGTVDLADARFKEKALGAIGFATEDILDGEIGEVTFIGKVNGLNTIGGVIGDVIYLDITPGGYTSVIPASPSYSVNLGTYGKIDATTGIIYAKIIPGDNIQSAVNFWNGSILESFTSEVTSNGTTITLTLEKVGGGDLSLFFDGLFYKLDCTPALTIALTPGTDAVPVRNYVYIPLDTKVLTVSTSGWDTTQQIVHIADVICQSAASFQTYGAYKNHKWSDNIADGGVTQGAMATINYWVRKQKSTYDSGVVPSVAITVNPAAKDNVFFSSTAGLVLQRNQHIFPAKDMATGDGMYIINRYLLPYSRITDLNAIVNTSTGATLLGNNTYYTIFVYGIVSEATAECKYFANVPSGFYTNETDGKTDPLGYTNKALLTDYRGTAFPIAGIVLRYQTAASGTITLVEIKDLREDLVGGGGTAGTTTSIFTDAAFKIENATDPTKVMQFLASGITTGTTRTLTVPDASGGITLGAASSTDNAIARYDGATGKILQNSSATIDDNGNLKLISSDVVISLEDSTDNFLNYILAITSLMALSSNRNPNTGVFSDVNKAACDVRMETNDSDSSFNVRTSAINNTLPTLKFKVDKDGKIIISIAPTVDTTALPPLVRDTSTGEIKTADLSYTALTAGAAVSYSLITGMHKTLSVAVDSTITFTNMATAVKNPFGDIRLNVTVISSIILAGTGVTFSGNNNLSALPIGEYHLYFKVISATQIDYNLEPISNKTLNKYQVLTSAVAVTMDTSVSNNAKMTIAHNSTITLTNLVDGDEGNIIITQDGTGGRTLAISPTPAGDRWGGTDTSIDSTLNNISKIKYTYDGVNLIVECYTYEIA